MGNSTSVIYILSPREESIAQGYKDTEYIFDQWKSYAWRFWSFQSIRPSS